MDMRGRLKTTNRISKWLNISNTLCPLCKKDNETHCHLFFKCDFSKMVWNNFKPLYKFNDLSCVWAEIISGISINPANNSIWSVVQRLVFGAAVYYIWQERNFRIFQNNFRTEENVFRIIVDTVRHKLMGLSIKKSREVDKFVDIWKLPMNSSVGGNRMGHNVFDGIT